MHKLELKELLKKYREQKCTRDELNTFQNLMMDNKNEESIKELLSEDLNLFPPDHDNAGTVEFHKIYQNITLRIEKSEGEKVFKPVKDQAKLSLVRYIKVASVLMLFLLSGGVLSYVFFNQPEEPNVIAYNEIKAPLGARSEVLLPDGSRIWLNAGSTIRYLNVFNKVNRFVFLEGEAYFKVAKNSKLPFQVETGDLNIVAVGTEFNVKSYNDEGIIETTLVEGKVSIRHNRQERKKSMIFLEPHQKAIYIKEDQRLTVEDLQTVQETKPEVLALKRGIMYVADQIDPEPIISWKEDRLILRGEELSNLLIKLERKYDVKFTYASEEIKHFRFTGTLENETLTQVLDVIKLSAPIEYELEGKTVRIIENKKKSKEFSGHLKKK